MGFSLGAAIGRTSPVEVSTARALAAVGRRLEAVTVPVFLAAASIDPALAEAERRLLAAIAPTFQAEASIDPAPAEVARKSVAAIVRSDRATTAGLAVETS